MPRYYFHIRHDTYLPDEEGEDLPDKHAAWREATVMAAQMLQGIDGKLQPGHDWQMEVTVRPWTEEDDTRLLQMVAQKRHRSIIAASLKRTRSGIAGRLRVLRRSGRIDPACPDARLGARHRQSMRRPLVPLTGDQLMAPEELMNHIHRNAFA
jgi:hypothetical protein